MRRPYSVRPDSDDPLLELSPPGAGLSPRLLSAPGGFLWWYLDLVDETGDALVVIWSFGLPFLPGYVDAVRRGRPQPPRRRPSLNVSTYRDGALDFYLLQEFDPDEVHWETTDRGDRWHFGDSHLESLVDDGRRRVALDLDLDVPRLEGPARMEVRAEGPGCTSRGADHDPAIRRTDPVPAHDWVPLLSTCGGRAEAAFDGRTASWHGRVYHDRNGGRIPLNRLGIDHWIWGRIAMPDRELVYYELEADDGTTQSLVVAIGTDGVVHRLDDHHLDRRGRRTNLGGLTWWPSLSVRTGDVRWLDIEATDVVDSGPFYLRALLKATDRTGRTCRGVGEFCDPDRIDLARHRPLVQMRVHTRRDDNSTWLPLFTGPRSGRVRRLVRAMLPFNRNPTDQ